MISAYSLSKQTVEVKALPRGIDLNPWLTSIFSTLASYTVDAVTDLVVTSSIALNVVQLTFSAGAAGHKYIVGVNAVAANGQLSRYETTVTIKGTSSGDQSGGSGSGSGGSGTPSGGGGAWGTIGGSISDQTDLQAALAGKASTASVAAKADTTTVNTALALKANTTTVNTALALKADASALAGLAGISDLSGLVTTTALNTALAPLASQTYVANAVSTKADTSAVAAKADGAATTTALALKANTADVTTSLNLKANITDVAANLATALAGYSVTSHTHDISTLQNATSWFRSMCAAYLAEVGLLSSAPPAPSPSPAPAPGVGTGATETVAPSLVKPMGISNPSAGTYILNIGTWSTGSAAVDRFAITPRIDGTDGATVTYTTDQSAAVALAACTYGAYDANIGHMLSFKVVAYNEAATGGVIEYTTGIYVTASSTSPGSTGGTSVSGTGTLSKLSLANSANFTVSTVAGIVSYAVMPTAAGTIQKSGAPAITLAPIVGSGGNSVVDDSSAGTVSTTTWTDGTPTASGSTGIAVSTGYSDIGSGRSFTMAASATSQTFWLMCSIYSSTLTLACTLSDGSAAPLSIDLVSATSLTATTPTSAVSVNRLIAVTFKAGSAGQTLTVAATLTAIAGSGGNAHFGCAYVTAP